MLALGVLMSPVGAEQATDASAVRSHAGHFVLSYKSRTDPIVINRMHDWVIHVEDEKGNPVLGASIDVDGGMPAHDHGLPTAPRVTSEIGGGDYLLQGLRFHMNGEWQIDFEIEADGVSDTVTVLLQI